MKICIISKNYPPKICGVGDYTYWLAKNLIDKFDIYVITQNMEGRVHIPDYDKIKILSIEWNFFSIFNAIKKISPDIVNIQYVSQMYGKGGVALYIAILPIIIKIILKSKIVVTFHELQIKWSGRDFILGAIQRVQTLLLLNFSDAAIGTNDKRTNWLKSYSWHKKVYKIPVGANILPIENYFIPYKKKIILTTFGTLHPEKDFLTVFESISMIDNVEYWIIGKIDKNSYEFYKLIKKAKELKIENKIKWIINAPREKVAKCLLNTDIYISPEIGGPSGRRTTLVAAFCFALPVIAYDGYEKDSIFINNKNIILVKKGDKKMLTKKINFIINNKNEKLKLIDNAKKTYDNYFRWQIISNKYEEIFNSITK